MTIKLTKNIYNEKIIIINGYSVRTKELYQKLPEIAEYLKMPVEQIKEIIKNYIPSNLCCNEKHFLPKDYGYKLVYETDTDDYRVIVDPYGMRDINDF